MPGRVAQSVGHLSQGSWVRYPVGQHTFVSPSAFSRRAVVSYWRKYVHEILVNRLGGLSLPWKSVVRLTDRPDMTLDVYRGRKTTIQQQYNIFRVAFVKNISLAQSCCSIARLRQRLGSFCLIIDCCKLYLNFDVQTQIHCYFNGSFFL